MESFERPTLAEAMKGLWIRFLPQISERVSVLETAAAALTDGSLSQTQRELASSAAHKLAGVLGTFGLSGGTELAREAETYYSSTENLDISRCGRLSHIAKDLRGLISAQE